MMLQVSFHLKIAVGVLVTGAFSLFEAIQQFLIASIGGPL